MAKFLERILKCYKANLKRKKKHFPTNFLLFEKHQQIVDSTKLIPFGKITAYLFFCASMQVFDRHWRIFFKLERQED